jgi:hypothetical protein
MASPPSVMCFTSESDVKSFVDDLAREYFLDGPDRRTEPRLRVTLPVNIQPLDEGLQPLGYRARAVTRDVSECGVGLVCQDPANAGYLALQVPTPRGDFFEVVTEVLRCRPVGYYFDVGCRFVFGRVTRESDGCDRGGSVGELDAMIASDQ